MSKAKKPNSAIKIKGMFRLQIEDGPSGKIVGDSGWVENLVTNAGFSNIVNLLGSSLAGTKFTSIALGTGGAPVASSTALAGELSYNSSGSNSRINVNSANSGSTTLRNTATFASGASFITTTYNISNIGLFNVSGPLTSSGSLFCGTTYSSSALASNQQVNVTYDLVFS